MTDLRRTCLYGLHQELGARLVPFAGYEMPVQYPMGVLNEHLHTRSKAGLFDVSHMGQVILRPRRDMASLAAAFEAMMPVDVAGLPVGRQRYGLFTNDQGGILDDLMFANWGEELFVVVNAACKEADTARMTDALSDVAEVLAVTDRALLALQGPRAEAALASIAPAVTAMRFMDVITSDSAYGALWISRSGYSGEDGFEVSVAEAQAEPFARALLALPGVAPIGLGARDSLRLEAGLCLYGHDIDTGTSPVEAGLTWAIQKSRRSAGGFPGAARILRELAEGPARLRVGLRPEGRAPMREGTPLFAAEDAADQIGAITSGGFGPSLNAPLAMAYVPAALATVGTRLWAEVRGKRLPALIAPMPFHPTTYRK